MKGIEVRKCDEERIQSGFYSTYLKGHGLDIGYKGMGCPAGVQTVVPNATGLDLDSPGYDGLHLPYQTGSLDFVFASHVLEHIADYVKTLQEWHRALKPGGYMVLLLPHGFLYERSFYVPGPWGEGISASCSDHKRVYTPARLLRELEESLRPNSYRVRSLRDNDKNFNYSIDLKQPPHFFEACFEIECVVQKIVKPAWGIE